MHLSERHGTAVKPYIYKVKFTLHCTTGLRYQDYIIHIRTVQVNLIIVLCCVDTGLETLLLERIGFHHAGLYRLFNLIIEFLYRADAQLVALIVTPDRQRSAPVAATAQVPVIQVLKPLAETACSG